MSNAPPSSLATARMTEIRTTVLLYAIVAAGGISGSVLRWLLGLAAPLLVGSALPWGTLFANVTGSFAIGFFARLSGPDGRLFVGPRTRQFFMTGVCGGYTTFSMFTLETLHFVQSGDLWRAVLYLLFSIVTWLAAAWAGDVVAMRLNKLPRSKPKKAPIMKIPKQATLLRIFIGENDQHAGKPLYEAITLKAREMHLAGATVLRGAMGFGHSSRLHTAKILRLSDDLPLVIEIVDAEDKIRAFLASLNGMMSSALVTLEKVEVVQYGADAGA